MRARIVTLKCHRSAATTIPPADVWTGPLPTATRCSSSLTPGGPRAGAPREAASTSGGFRAPCPRSVGFPRSLAANTIRWCPTSSVPGVCPPQPGRFSTPCCGWRPPRRSSPPTSEIWKRLTENGAGEQAQNGDADVGAALGRKSRPPIAPPSRRRSSRSAPCNCGFFDNPTLPSRGAEVMQASIPQIPLRRPRTRAQPGQLPEPVLANRASLGGRGCVGWFEPSRSNGGNIARMCFLSLFTWGRRVNLAAALPSWATDRSALFLTSSKARLSRGWWGCRCGIRLPSMPAFYLNTGLPGLAADLPVVGDSIQNPPLSGRRRGRSKGAHRRRLRRAGPSNVPVRILGNIVFCDHHHHFLRRGTAAPFGPRMATCIDSSGHEVPTPPPEPAAPRPLDLGPTAAPAI